MADKKISDLTIAASAVAAMMLEVNDAGTSKSLSLTKLFAGIIVNEGGDDNDSRFEGANNANLIVLDAGQDALSFGGANVDGAAFALNNLQQRTHITAVGAQFHMPAQITDFDNGSETIAIGSAAFIGIPTWTNASATLTMTKAATLYIEGPPVGSTNVTVSTGYGLWVDAGAVQFDGTLQVEGAVTFTTDLTVPNGGTGVSTLTDGGVLLGSGTGAITAMAVLADSEMIVGNGTTDPVAESGATLRTSIGVGTGDVPQFDGLGVGVAGASGQFLLGAGLAFINETVNAGMTVGLTINQGANDDEILALKSSDVGHAMTDFAEADTFGLFEKADAAAGGLSIQGFRDADGAPSVAMQLSGRLGEAASTADTPTSTGVIDFVSQITDAGTGVTVVADAGNVLSVRNNTTTRLIIKGDGAVHITNVVDVATTGFAATAIALADAFDDVALVRAHQRTVYHDMGVAMTKWDESMALGDNVNILKRLGVLSSQGDFTIVHRMHSLLGGAIWQSHVERKELEQAIAETMPAIAARLEEIRAERKSTALPN